jgi:hypothetical protein
VKHVTIHTLPCTVYRQSPSREDTTRPVFRNLGDSALSIRSQPGLDPTSTPAQFNRKGRMVWHRAPGHFINSSSTSPSCPGIAGHSQGTSPQSPQQGSTKHHLKAPRRPSLLRPIKGQAGGLQRTTNNRQDTKEINISSNHPCTLFSSLRLGLAALSRKLVTPTRAPRCKEIQNSLPPLDVGPSFARTRINLRVFSLHNHPG